MSEINRLQKKITENKKAISGLLSSVKTLTKAECNEENKNKMEVYINSILEKEVTVKSLYNHSHNIWYVLRILAEFCHHK